jgi:putative nucleotidyltransferase with HDIG domain
MEGKIDELPLLPQVLVKIMQLSPSSNDYFEQFEHLAKEDPGFAVRIIALANSASSSPVVPIASISNALTRMGTQTICSLVASLAVQRVFTPTKPNEIRLWQHSISTALAAQRIAELAPQLGVNPGEAYLTGLLHDIGRFIMFEHASAELQKVDEANWQSPDELIDADVEIFKFTHSELGYLACMHWGMPDLVSAVIKDHHSPISEDITPGSMQALMFCVQIADRLCISLIEQPELVELNEQESAKRIGFDCLQTPYEQSLISPAVLAANVEQIRTESNDILSGLGFAPT